MIRLCSDTNWHCFLDCIGDLLATDEVQSMDSIPHHIRTTCYEHSVHVSYVAFRLARRLKLDYMAAARAGLLHDLYLYNPRIPGTHQGSQCFDHPVAALENAKALCGELSHKEENIIISHMWPLARKMPRSREAVVICCVDKLCAAIEGLQLYHRRTWRARLSAAV